LSPGRRPNRLAVQLDIESQLPRPINFQLAPDINRSASLSTSSGFPWCRVLRLYRRSMSDLRRPSILRLCQGVDFQLPPELRPALHLQISFQLAPDTASSDFTFGPTSNSSSAAESSSLPSSQLSTFADCQPSSLAFGLDLQLSPAIASSGFTFAPDLQLASDIAPSGSAFQPNLRLFIGYRRL